jgi:hypothetical protein
VPPSGRTRAAAYSAALGSVRSSLGQTKIRGAGYLLCRREDRVGFVLKVRMKTGHKSSIAPETAKDARYNKWQPKRKRHRE